MNVWTYWAGPKPAWIDVCLKSIARCCKRSTFHLLTPENVDAALAVEVHPKWTTPALPSSWKDLPPGVGTDCLRAALLAIHGGLWIDADTVCLRDPIDLITRQHDRNQFLYSQWSNPPERVVAGYVYSPKGHPTARIWLDIVCSVLSNGTDVGWGLLGEKALGIAVRACPDLDVTWPMPLGTFLPIDFDADPRAYLWAEDWRPHYQKNRTIAFGLNHSWMMANAADIVEGRAGAGTIVRRLLGHAEELNR